MEVDVKKEQKRVQDEIQQLSDRINQLANSIAVLQQQRQELINQLLMRQGELHLLERLNGKEHK